MIVDDGYDSYEDISSPEYVVESDEKSVFKLVCDLASQVLGCSIAVFAYCKGKNREWKQATLGLDNVVLPLDEAFFHTLRQTKRSLVVLDASCDSRFKHHRLVTGSPHIRFFAGAPLLNSKNECFGLICVSEPTRRQFLEQNDVILMENLANLACTTMLTHCER